MKNRSLQQRVGFALSGLVAAWRRERSFQTEAVIGAAAIVALFFLRPGWVWWAIVVLTIAVVLAAELMNSAIEGLIDHLHPERHPEIRIVKDIAAAGVLLTCAAAVMIGGFLVASLIWG